MRKRIGSKLYDTDTAIKVCEHGNIALYKKKNTPEFFAVFGEERIEPFTWKEAEAFVRVNGTDKDFVRFFSLEDKSKTVTNTSKTIRFSDYDIARIKLLAGNQPMSQFLLSLVDEYERTHK